LSQGENSQRDWIRTSEISKKDLGIESFYATGMALAQKVRLGQNQALIYSSDDVGGFGEQAKDWVGAHPFILSSLDSKV
jgi:hypothetical protein